MNANKILSAVGLACMLVVGAPDLSASEQTSATLDVDAKRKPGDEWKSFPTRTTEHLPKMSTDATRGLSKYGGLSSSTGVSSGFFRAFRGGDRWWLIDPEGNLFIHVGIVSVRPGTSENSRAAFDKIYGSVEGWSEGVVSQLKDHGFNGTGAWSDTDALRRRTAPLVYTMNWSFMSSYGKKRGGTFQKPGHTGYPNDCIFVFDPEFESFCDEYASQLAATKDDPWLLGHFSDNEMPLEMDALENYLGLPEGDAGYQAALDWLKVRLGPRVTVIKDAGSTPTLSGAVVTDQLREDFLGYVTSRYFRIVSTAIRKHDPNHLYLGARFHGSALREPIVFKAAGPYVDVVSVNYYNAWTPRPELLSMWSKESGRPFMITEFYVKGMDSGMGNTSGAGWIVRTQADRGRFYQNFVLGLLESGNCVGWHWFRYMDNDPGEKGTDPSNRDSNKGIVSSRYEAYEPLLAAMTQLNQRVYGLAHHMDSVRAKATKEPGKPKGEQDDKWSEHLASPPGVVIEQDIPYLDAGRAEKLDLYRPAERTTGTLSPAVVIIHGGGWTGGNKARRREYITGTTLARHGYVCISIEYMRDEGRRWPTNVQDCKNAVRWLRKNAAQLQIDPDRIGLIGGSAGGHLAMMVAYTPGLKELDPEAPYPGISDNVQACVNMYGPSNIVTRVATDADGNPTDRLRECSLFPESREQAPEKWRLASPVNHITEKAPPTLIIHSSNDTTVDRLQSEELAHKLAEKNVDHRLIMLSGGGHAFALDEPTVGMDLVKAVIDFLDQHLKQQPSKHP